MEIKENKRELSERQKASNENSENSENSEEPLVSNTHHHLCCPLMEEAIEALILTNPLWKFVAATEAAEAALATPLRI